MKNNHIVYKNANSEKNGVTQMEKGYGEVNTIGGLIDAAAEKFGPKACIKWLEGAEERMKTYEDLRNDSYRAAKVIAGAVGGRLCHTAMIGSTDYGFLTFLNGIFIAGHTLVPIAADASPDEIRELIRAADCECVVCDGGTALKTAEALAGSGLGVTILNRNAAEDIIPAESLPACDPDRCAMIMFTSGTTGKKKGVMLSSRALISNVMFKEMSFEGDHVALNVLPMHHIFSFSCDYLKNLKDGVTICLAGGPSNLFKAFAAFEPTLVRLVPMLTETLLKRTDIVRKHRPDLTPRQAGETVFGTRLRSIISSGAKLDPVKAARFEEMGVEIRQGYGMTETGPRIAVPNGKTDIDSAGAIISIVTPRIQDGELQIKSPSLMSGYYKDPEATAEAFTEDGWFRTGDTGYITEEGLLYITGRVKNLIILSNGENVSPEEIENTLTEYRAICEVIVRENEGRIEAEIYPDPDFAGTDPDGIRAAVEKAVEEYNGNTRSEKEIGAVAIRSTPFPKTSSGKIIRKAIEK